MDYEWSESSRAAFYGESHRARYLRSSALCSLPPPDTPLYAVQYVIQRTPVYLTTLPSLVLFAAENHYYLATTTELGEILGLDRKEPRKLNSANWLWDRSSLDKGKDKDKDNRKHKDARMSAFKHDSLELAHVAITQYRRSGLSETFTAGDLYLRIPRPGSNAAAVGRGLGTLVSSDPPTRSGERHRFKKRKKMVAGEGEGEDSSEI